MFAEPEHSIATYPTSIDGESQLKKKPEPQTVEGVDWKLDADTLKGCGCLTVATWILGYYVLFHYGCVGPSIQERKLESEKIAAKTQAENRKQQLEEDQRMQQRIAAEEERFQSIFTEKLAAQEYQHQQEIERMRQAAKEKAPDRMRLLQAIRNSPPQETMIQCLTYLSLYNSVLFDEASDARIAWQEATFDGNLPAMREHYAELQRLLGREFLGYYWDIHDIMRDENKVKRILAESAEFRRKNRQ